MIVVRIELHSAVTRKVTEIGRMTIANIGGTDERGDYRVATNLGRSAAQLDRNQVTRCSEVHNYPRQTIHVWHLVARALIAMGYAGKAMRAEPADLFQTPERQNESAQ